MKRARGWVHPAGRTGGRSVALRPPMGAEEYAELTRSVTAQNGMKHQRVLSEYLAANPSSPSWMIPGTTSDT